MGFDRQVDARATPAPGGPMGDHPIARRGIHDFAVSGFCRRQNAELSVRSGSGREARLSPQKLNLRSWPG
jgi:hypothetical protein